MKWVAEEHQQYDLALTLHWANSYWADSPRYRPTLVEPANAYRNDVRHFFNIVDRKLFGSAHRRYGKRFGRLVSLHCSPGVGWHVHAAVRTPDGFSQSEFIQILERTWRKHLGHHAERSNIETRLFDAQQNRGNFASYTIRHENGTELDINKHDVGVSDWENTALQRRNVH